MTVRLAHFKIKRKMSRFLDHDASGWPFVKTTLAYDVVDSTSDRAAELVREGRCSCRSWSGLALKPRAGAGAPMSGGPTPAV